MSQNQCLSHGAEEIEAQAMLAERRNTPRVPVIKSGKVVVGGDYSQGVLNCLVLDETALGVLIDLGALFVLPEEMVLHISSGSYKARRRWAVGTKAGLEFVGTQVVSTEIAAQKTKLLKLLEAQGVRAAMAMLRAQNYFNQPDLRRTAEEVEAAYYRFEAMLDVI